MRTEGPNKVLGVRQIPKMNKWKDVYLELESTRVGMLSQGVIVYTENLRWSKIW